MSGVHAPISFSSLGMTVACNASVLLQAQAPTLPETEEEAEGSANHWLALQFAVAGAALPIGSYFGHGGRTWEVTIDRHNGATSWAKLWGPQTRFEHHLRAISIHSEHCAGTPDAFEYLPAGAPRTFGQPLIRVGDYKSGHRYVEVFENFQLLAAYVGVRELLRVHDDNLWVEFIIHQPFCYGVERTRAWLVRAQGLRGLVNIAANEAGLALGPKPVARTGTHCPDCKARHACRVLKYSTDSLVDFSGAADLLPLDDTALGAEAKLVEDAIARLEARHTGLQAQVEAVLRAHRSVPHYELKPGQSKRTWNDGVTPEDVGTVGDLFGVDLRKPPQVFTPTQAIDAGIDESVISPYSTRPPGALRVKRSSNIETRKALGVIRK